MPGSIKSILVSTLWVGGWVGGWVDGLFHLVLLLLFLFLSTYPMVRRPSGSTSRASFKESELAMSVLAAVTASTIELGFPMYCRHMSRI